MSKWTHRFGGMLVVFFILMAYALDGAHAAAPSPAKAKSAHAHAASVRAAPMYLRTDALAQLCGAHRDVAPTMDARLLSALLSALRAQPEHLGELCELWHSYREI